MALGLIFSSFFRALSQVGDRRFRRVLLLGILLALALLVAATVALIGAIQLLMGEAAVLPLIGEVTWADDLLSWTSFLVMMVLSIFLMMPVASAITSMFLDRVAQAVEDRHYPALPPARQQPVMDGLRDGVNFLGALIAANIFAFLLYMLFPPFAPLIFWSLNGYLLGREYFTLAAIRRMGRAEADALRRRHGLTIWAAGTLMAMPLSVPLLNLAVPIIGAATFTHLFHGLARR